MVKYSEYNDAFPPRNVKDEIRKPRNYGAPNAAI